MGMSDFYGPADEAESIATIHAALDAGIMLLDTGDYYAAGHNELLIGRALRDRRDKALVSVKFGALRGPDGSWLGMDTRPIAVKNFLAYSLTRLGLDHVDLYRPGRLDPNVPIEDTVGAIAESHQGRLRPRYRVVRGGTGYHRRAQAVHPISDLQIEYPSSAAPPETDLSAPGGVRHRRDGLRCPVARPAQWLKPNSAKDFRAYLPRFSGENRERNQRLIDALQKLASERDVTVSQLAIAWVLAKGHSIVPLIGARKRSQLAESIGALQVELSPADVARLEEAVPPSAVAGTRYDEHQMGILDSER